MVKVRSKMLVRYGHFNDVFEISEKINEVAREEGWVESRLWIGESGRDNTFVVETDYPDMASFERESAAAFQHDGFMKLFRQLVDHVVEGSSYTEFFSEARRIA